MLRLPHRFSTVGFAVFALSLAACASSSPDRPPLVNSGSYDWRDAYRGPGGYPLAGWGAYFAKPN